MSEAILDDASPGALSKSAIAYEVIRAGISDGTYPPGSRLVIDQLSRDLAVSAVPIREAIRRLEAGGYVTFQKNLGATVATIEAEAYGESMETLAVLEGAATALAATRLDAVARARARALNASMRESLERLDPVQFTTGNHDLHRVIYTACPNTHLFTLIEREWDRLTTIRRSTFAFIPERAREAVAEHDELLDMLDAGASPEKIEHFARAHRMRTAHRFLNRWAADRPGDREETS